MRRTLPRRSARATAALLLAEAKCVGAVLAPPAVTGAVVAALRARGWLLRGRSVCSHGDDEKAVFLNVTGAASLARAAAAATLGVEGVAYAPGLRVGSRRCGGPRGQQTNSAIYLLRATEASRTRAEGSCSPSSCGPRWLSRGPRALGGEAVRLRNRPAPAPPANFATCRTATSRRSTPTTCPTTTS